MAQQTALNGRELVADDVKFTYDRFLMEQGNPYVMCWSLSTALRSWTAIR